jgi:flagellar basal-body rod protein FlgC
MVKSPGDAVSAVAVSALRAQQARMRIIAENIANSSSTAKMPGGEPYRRQVPVFKVDDIEGAKGVALARVEPDTSPFPQEYDPSHPAANKDGYVLLPNVSGMIETMDMQSAIRAYEANLNILENQDAIDKSSLSILDKG